MMRTFYLGTHKAVWLARSYWPLFLSHRTLRERKTFPRAVRPWALDSGAFTSLQMDGCHLEPTRAYAAAIRRYAAEIGQLEWAAPQDWMCEPAQLRRTGLTVAQHQWRTVQNWLELVELQTPVPVVPVLQGWSVGDYFRCADLYANAGVDLFDGRLVGLGSICRRSTTDATRIVAALKELKLPLHAFGVQGATLRRLAATLHSSDSLAWSLNARTRPPLAGCTHASCANCLRYAQLWAEQSAPPDCFP